MAALPAQTPEKEPGVVGYVGVTILFLLIGWGIYALFTKYLGTRPAVISLSAYFVDNSGGPVTSAASGDVPDSHLKIAGDVRQSGQPLNDGSVRLTVTRQDHSFQQTISVDLDKKGQFGTEDPAFRSLKPDDQIAVTAEASSAKISEPATATLYLNTGPPTLTKNGEVVILAILAVLLSVFFYSFTGRKTNTKNRVAIIFSYIIIGIFLGIALLAPVLLIQAFPNLKSAMIGKPVGLVVTRIGGQKDEAQWAINIGGYSTARKVEVPAPTPAIKSAEKAAPKEAPKNQAGNPDENKGATAPDQNPPAPVPANPTSQSSGNSRGASQKPASPDNEDVIQVEGGLVIPLYVIILSIIGGAINMTRKVPRLQREGEFVEVPVPKPAKIAASKVESLFGISKVRDGKADARAEATQVDAPEAALDVEKKSPAALATAAADDDKKKTEPAAVVPRDLPDSPEVIDARLDQLAKQQVQRNNDTQNTLEQIRTGVQQIRETFDARDKKKDTSRILGFDSFEDWLGSRAGLKELVGSTWRVELLNQYMYLISAPFLAIVAYYMLDLLGLSGKQPVLVLISFSVGLISERILSWLLGIAGGYLRSDAAGAPANK